MPIKICCKKCGSSMVGVGPSGTAWLIVSGEFPEDIVDLFCPGCSTFFDKKANCLVERLPDVKVAPPIDDSLPWLFHNGEEWSLKKGHLTVTCSHTKKSRVYGAHVNTFMLHNEDWTKEWLVLCPACTKKVADGFLRGHMILPEEN